MSATASEAVRRSSALFRTARHDNTATKEHRRHIQLRSLPRSATPADVRRMVVRAQLQNVIDVAIDYYRFLPSGRAYLSLTHPDVLRGNLNLLQRQSVSSIPLQSFPSPPPINQPPNRTRGTKGRVEAAERGIITGNGPGGGVPERGKSVVVWGLPGKMTPEALRTYLKSFQFAGGEGGQRHVVKLDLPEGAFSLTSRHLVRMASVLEAHRLVREIHMTYYRPESWGSKYQLRARVVY